MEGEAIELVSYEGTVFRVPISIVEVSEVLKGAPDYNSQFYLDTLEIDDESIKYIITYLEHHEYKPISLGSKKLTSNDLVSHLIDPWDADFINSIEHEQLLKLIFAAQKLDIKTLLEIACIKIATTLRMKDETALTEEYRVDIKLLVQYEGWIKEDYAWAAGVDYSILGQ